jgi:hypothetical protein
MCTLGDAADVNPVMKFLRHALQRVSQELLMYQSSQFSGRDLISGPQGVVEPWGKNKLTAGIL